MLLVAVALLSAGAAVSPPATLQIQSGLSALDRKDFAAAVSYFEKAVRLTPRDASVWLLLAQTYAKQSNGLKASEAARQAETYAGSDPAILQGLVHYYVELQPNLERAAELQSRYAVSKSGSPQEQRKAAELHGAVAEESMKRKEWGNAIGHLGEALKLTPRDEQAHFRLAQAYMFQQQFDPALAVLQNARKHFPNSPQIELTLGVAFYGLRRFPEAVDQFVRAAKLAPDVPQPYAFLGRILEHSDSRLPEIASLFADYHRRHPENYLGYLLHAKALLASSEASGDELAVGEAETLLAKAISLQPNDAELEYQYGTVLERRGQYADAAGHLERSLQLNPREASAHFRLSRVYGKLGRTREAAEQRALHQKLNDQGTGDIRK